MAPTTIKCPKCNYEQPEADECIRCGLIISKFIDPADTSQEEKPQELNSIRPENSSGQGKGGHVPSELDGWNWGAFFLNFVWAIGNRTWIGLLTLVPVIGLPMPVLLGIKGNAWAWQNNHWGGIEHFRIVQRKWAVWSVCAALVVCISGAGLLYFGFRTGEPEIGSHLASVEWLPDSATDINYYKRSGFRWIKNYDCAIPEEDFLTLAEKKKWYLQEGETYYFYELRHESGGGVTVSYDKESQRLAVISSHR